MPATLLKFSFSEGLYWVVHLSQSRTEHPYTASFQASVGCSFVRLISVIFLLLEVDPHLLVTSDNFQKSFSPFSQNSEHLQIYDRQLMKVPFICVKKWSTRASLCYTLPSMRKKHKFKKILIFCSIIVWITFIFQFILVFTFYFLG